MTDLKRRLRGADSMSLPDGLWDEVVRRSGAALPGEPMGHEPRRSDGRQAAVTAAVALVVAAAGSGGAFVALRGGEPPQRAQTASEGRIVFAAPGGSTWQLFSANPDGTDVAQLTQIEPAFVVHDPAWSADGTHLAYVVREADTDRGVIWVSDADGSDARPITGDMHAIDPSWSPDGSQIAFTRVDGADATQIWIVDIATGRAEPFTHCTLPECVADSSPAWSPDGRSLAFVRQAGAGAVVAASIYVWPTNEGTVENTGYASVQRADYVGDMTWSPDGSRIAMTIAAADRSAIYVVDSSPHAPMFEAMDDQRGMPERLATPQALYASSPAWSPDGNRIAFVVSAEGHDRLYVANADGTQARPIPSLPDNVSSLSWQPVVAPRLDGEATTPAPLDDITDATIGHRIDVGQASALMYAEGSVWVVTGPEPSTLIRIEGATGEVQARIPVDVFPDAVHGGGGIAYDGSAIWLVGTSWTADGPRSGVLVRVDPSTNEAETYDLPVGLAGSQLVLDGGFLWTTGVSAPGKDPRVLQIDPSSATVVSQTPIDAEWWGGLVVVDGAVWITQMSVRNSGVQGDAELVRLEAGTGDVLATVPLVDDDGTMVSVAPIASGGTIWAPTGSELLGLNPETGALVSTVDVLIGGDLEAGIDGSLWCLCGNGWDSVERIATPTAAGFAFAPEWVSTPIALAVGPDAVWVLTEGGTLEQVVTR